MGKAKRSDTEEERNKNKDCGYFTNGIANWRPRGTGDLEPWRKQEVGVGRMDREMPVADQGQK